MNIKLVSSEGSTFTVENINGNKQVLDLDTIEKHLRSGSTSSNPQTYFKDTGGAPYDIGDTSGVVLCVVLQILLDIFHLKINCFL